MDRWKCPAGPGSSTRRIPKGPRSHFTQGNRSAGGHLMTTSLDSRVQVKSIAPVLTVDDLQKSIAFFEGLGFEVEERWEENGTLLGVMQRADEARLNLSQDDWNKGRDRRKGEGMRLSLNTSHDIDQLTARAKKAGIALDSEPHDTDWGSRAFEVTEPTGFKLTIGSE